MTAARRWRSVDSSLRWYERAGEPEIIAFSPRSGSLHLLATSVRPLLEALSATPLTAEEIVSLFGPMADVEQHAAAAIESLDLAGLIEPAP